MRVVTVDAILGSTADVRVCRRCRAFWFEPFQTVQLTPAATLTLFRVMAEISAGPPAPFPATSACPECGDRLLPTHDRQRNTKFEYLRCDRGHGRFTRFVDFLKEKDFIRRLSAAELGELRRKVRMIHCANCGAPFDLGSRSVCEHCGSTPSMLDVSRLARVAREIETKAPAAPVVPARLPRRNRVSGLITSKDQQVEADPIDLVAAGMRAALDWLRDALEPENPTPKPRR